MSHMFARGAQRPLLLACLSLLFLLGAGLHAQELRFAPRNPNFSSDAPVQAPAAGQRAPHGYRASPVTFAHLRGMKSSLLGATQHATTYPSSYDLRTAAKVTPVKDQGDAGDCWAFAAMGSLESCLLPGETWDFSENNLKNNSGFDPDPNNGGGNRDMATAYFARWSGPVSEADDPYNAYSTTSPTNLTVRKHLQQAIYLPERTGPTDNDGIKAALMSYGAIDAGMYYDDASYNAATYAFYYHGYQQMNHGITIVGWDDNYSSANFIRKPAGNGAFIVKNSWGTSWGQAGYFYVSYYDSAIAGEPTVYCGAEATTDYTHVYQYDPLGLCDQEGFGNSTGWIANIFTAGSAENLSAVSWYAMTPDTAYQVSVYLNPANGPLSSTAALTQSGTMTTAGYHTLPLQTPVALASGQRFSVVVKLTTPGFQFPIPVEDPVSGYSSGAHNAAGESYTSPDGVTWTDLTTKVANAAVCLKAFTTGGSTPTPTPTPTKLTAVTLTAAPASPQPVNTVVTLQATATGGSGAILYLFEVNAGSGWTTLQSYSQTATCPWTPTVAGAFTLRVTAHDTANTVVTGQLVYTVTAGKGPTPTPTPTKLTAVTLTASPASSQPVKTPVTLQATATGGSGVILYFFQVNNGASWTNLQAFSQTATCPWTPTAAGTYTLRVTAHDTANTVVTGQLVYTVTAATPTPAPSPSDKPPFAVIAIATPGLPQPVNTAITVQARALGGSGTMQYKFEVGAGLPPAWTTLQDFSTTATCVWTPTTAGGYQFRVSARVASLPNAVVSQIYYAPIAAPLTGVTLTITPATGVVVNQRVTLQVASTGGSQVAYKFLFSADGGKTWQIVRNFDFTPSLALRVLVAGSYQFEVVAQDGPNGTPITSTPVTCQVGAASQANGPLGGRDGDGWR